ncbi:MAG: hypothetical protein J0I12_14170 [Candidatus Eremiobacteraeota bacterium]|nr:hypothetical protein [Candidatus Eremiobacteraeota bacterium]
MRRALPQVSLQRLAVIAMLERTLKHLDPDSYEAYLCALEADLPAERSLALLPARAARGLDASLQKRRAELALQALEQLSRAPKAISLSNAEELLSQRVYTQPGHFLFELLQNAEDSQARTFEVRFEDHQVVVWHDGLPFDVRDVVGVTSIGQTTKKKQQIGFFGVGFKAVYEVTDRPQIYSEVFQFEIIDVSIPRPLERPDPIRGDGTTLVLPLKKPFQAIPALDPGVLLALSYLQEIRWGSQVLRRDQQAFRVDESEHVYAGPAREPGRPDRTRLVVALFQNDLGEAVDPPAGAPTIYSYLPTNQPSGLRFLVHSHFDLPVDRERIHPESAWNEWILQQIPAALLRLKALEQLPLPGEAQGPFAFLPEAVGRLFADQPCLPGGRVPRQTRLARPEMLELELPLPLWAPDGRARQVAEQTLQCQVFDLAALVSELERGVRPGNLGLLFRLLLPEVEALSDRLWALPLFHGRPLQQLARAEERLRKFWPAEELIPAEWDEHGLFEALALKRLGPADLLERLEAGTIQADPEVCLEILGGGPLEIRQRARSLPLFSTQFGLQSLEQACFCVEPLLADFYRLRRPLLDQEYADWNPPRLDWATLVQDLLAGRVLEIPHDLLEVGFREVPEALLRQLAERPLWPDRPLVGPTARLRPAHPQVPQLLPELSFLPADLWERAHVRSLTPEPVGVAAVLEAMGRGQQSDAALAYLIEHADEINAGDSRRLLAQARLPDDRGQMAPLGQMHRAESSALRALYEGSLHRHFLGPESERLLSRLGLAERLPEVGLNQLVQDLASVRLDDPRPVLQYLASRAGELSRAQAEQLLALPLFPDRPLGEWALVEPEVAVCLPFREAPPAEIRGWAEELAAAALRKPAGIPEALALYGQDPPGWTQSQLLQFLKLLAARDFQGPELNRLPLWPALSGRRLLAEEVAELGDLRELMDTRDWELSPAAWQSFCTLLKPRTSSELLRLRLTLEARPGRPLLEQPDFLQTPEQVLKVAERLDGLPLVDGLGCLRPERLYSCALTTMPLLSAELLAQVTPMRTVATRPLPMSEVLAGLSRLPAETWSSSPDLRRSFYDWLVKQESEVFADAASRRLLASHPFWLTRGSRLLPAEDLVLDAGLPDLGVDWYPHGEIPEQVQSALARQLGLGQSKPRQLLESHLLPAYREAAARGQKERAQLLFVYLAEEFSDRPALLGKDFPVLDRRGRYRQASQVLWPDPELGLEEFLDEHLVSQHYNDAQVRLLRALGLASEPSWDMLRSVFQKPRRAAGALVLSRILAALYRRHGDEVLQQVPEYRSHSWLPDALGAPRTPRDLFVPGAECEALIGSHGRFYPDLQIGDLLGASLLSRLGLRDHRQVELPEVLEHLKGCSEAHQAVSFRLYQWLEEGLQRGLWPDLRQRLARQNWVYSDDGLWFNHRKVLGTHAFTYFGNRRGYWERGYRSCPTLCNLFEIPGRVEGAVVREFLEEIGAEVQRRGDREVLAGDRALARMLLACYTRLEGSPLDRKLPVILAQLRPGKEKRLVAAEHPGLVCSDTPSLERLFESTGKLLVAQTGNLEQRAAIEAFHGGLKIRNLRDSFRIRLQGEGREVSSECGPGLARLRTCLRSLQAVLPRVRRQREQLAPGGWQNRLNDLHTIRAIEELSVVYELPGVGSAPVGTAAAYHEGELLVNAELVIRADAPLTGLAQGLMPCLYQGPGEEQLVDILEILLPLTSRERMDSYLDARHFPASEEEPANPLRERLAEILDYQLDEKLRERFGELGDWTAERLADARTPAQAARALVGEDNPEATAALEEYFEASSLEQVLQPVAPPPPPPVVSPPAPHPVVRVTEAPAPEGLFTRLRNWFLGPQSEASEGLFNPYTPAQFVGANNATEKLEAAFTRPPASGLFHQPQLLPRPYLYATSLICGQFDPRRQLWLPLPRQQLAGFAPGQPTGRLLPFQGTLQPGLSRLPLPLYSRLHGEIETSTPISVRHGELGEVLVQTQRSVPVRFQVEILSPPRPLEGEVVVPPAWRQPTLEQLPEEVTAFLTAQQGRSAWEKALAAQEFMQTHYAYDAEFGQHPEARKALARPHHGRGHHQLEVLHAGRSSDWLGAGICYELNAMLCELLRRLGLPALLASGWVLDEGFLEHPDHIFTLAVLHSVDGPCLLPLDGTSSTVGPLRQFKRRQPPANPITGKPRMPAQPEGIWGVTGTLRPVDSLELMRNEESELLEAELRRYRQAVELVLRRRGLQASPEVARALRQPGLAHLGVLQASLREMLGAEVAAALLRLLAGDYTSLVSLPPAVAELVRLELAQVRTVPVLQVLPIDPTDPRS